MPTQEAAEVLMRKPEQAPEPSIEEILASIRRIIADDAPAAAAVDVGNHDAQAQAEEASVQASGRRIRSVEGGPRQSEPRGEDEVLELTEDFMLAEEAPLMRLQEPEEPVEQRYANGHDDGYDAQHGYHETQSYRDVQSARDPYDTEAAVETHQQPAANDGGGFARAVAEGDSGATASVGEGDDDFASVMAEVRQFVGLGPAPDADEQREAGAEATGDPEPEPEPELEPQTGLTAHATAQAETPAAENWGQPDIEALAPEPARPAPRWSARGKPAEPAPTTRDATAEAARSPAQPNLAGHDSWSQGVQMPVPEDGPAIPFATEALSSDAAMPSAPALSETKQPAAPTIDAAPSQETAGLELPSKAAQDAQPTPTPAGLQIRAEQLAERAVADFVSDKLSIPPVAEILKADRPLMDQIKNTVADALAAKGTEESEEFEDTPPLEAFAEEGFTAVAGAPQMTSGPARPAAPAASASLQPGSMEIGFLAARARMPVPAPASGPAEFDSETPELPREDDEFMLPQMDQADMPAYRSTPFAESPFMPQMPQIPSRMTTLQTTGRDMSMDRMQAAGSPKTLEDTVREMLKPLLVQWLNENMPRIINDAIKDEMAAAGLLTRSEPER